MAKTFRLGPVELDPIELGSQGNAVLGIRDSGKTYTATKLAEELFDAGVPFVAFDPIGVWRFLRVPGRGKGYPIVVAGGQEGDLPLSPQTAPMIVEAAMQNGVSVVIDLFDMKLSKADWRAIVRDCVRLLLHKNKAHGLRHIFLEEAAEFAPQKPLDGLVYAEIEKLARMGGNAGLGYTLINQRSQEVNKAVLELCDNLFLHRQKGKNALENLKKWLEIAGAAAGDVMRTLPTLPQGEMWAWLSVSDTPVHVKVPAKNSLHPDRRMMHGDAKAASKKAVKVDRFVKALEKTLPRLEEEAKSNDPVKLRAEIAGLRKQLEAAQRGAGPTYPDLREEVARLSPIAAAMPAIRRSLDQAWRLFEKVQPAIDQLSIGLDEIEKVVEQHMPAAIVRKAAGEDPRPPVVEHRPQAPIVEHNPRGQSRKALPFAIDYSNQRAGESQKPQGEVPSGCAKPLAVLAGAYPGGMTEAQWATAAGYKRTGGTWKEYRSRLTRASMIEKRDGLYFATDHGANSAGSVEVPPSPGPDLARWWQPKINVPKRVVEALIEAWPRSMLREDLAEQLEMAASGGSFKEYLSRLKRNELAVENSEGIRLTDAVMGAA